MSEYSDKFNQILGDLIDVMIDKGTNIDLIECLAHIDIQRRKLDKATWQRQALAVKGPKAKLKKR